MRTSPAAPRATRTRATRRPGPHYVYNVKRLLQKFDTATALVPQPVLKKASRKTRLGAIYYGSTSPAMDEALELLANGGIPLDALRLRAFPFPDSVAKFIAAHDEVFVVEQNRDAQMRTLLMSRTQRQAVAPGAGAALRRHADHRALHRRRDHAPHPCRDRRAQAEQEIRGTCMNAPGRPKRSCSLSEGRRAAPREFQ